MERGSAYGGHFPLLFVFYPFFVFLLTPTGHTRRPITTVYGSKGVFPRKLCSFGGLDDKKIMFGGQNSQKHYFWGPE